MDMIEDPLYHMLLETQEGLDKGDSGDDGFPMMDKIDWSKVEADVGEFMWEELITSCTTNYLTYPRCIGKLPCQRCKTILSSQKRCSAASIIFCQKRCSTRNFPSNKCHANFSSKNRCIFGLTFTISNRVSLAAKNIHNIDSIIESLDPDLILGVQK